MNLFMTIEVDMRTGEYGQPRVCEASNASVAAESHASRCGLGEHRIEVYEAVRPRVFIVNTTPTAKEIK